MPSIRTLAMAYGRQPETIAGCSQLQVHALRGVDGDEYRNSLALLQQLLGCCCCENMETSRQLAT